MKLIKNFIIWTLCLLFSIPLATLAYTGQYPWDPVYIAPTQETKNAQTTQELKSQYGVSAFYSCYPCIDRDTSNPYTETSCLSQTKYCLEKKAIQKETQCSSGYIYLNGSCESICASANHIYFNGKCVTIDEGCKEQYGVGGYYVGKKDSKGKYSCDCSSGYEWNDSGSYCTVKTETTTPQVKGTSIDANIPEGALIRVNGGIDIYIVKYIGNKRFKRLVLSPSVFRSYGHLKWEDILDVSQATLDSFNTSDLVRAVNDNNIYRLYPQGDIGEKRLIISGDVLTRLGLDSDSIYEINAFDRDTYITGLNLN